MSNPHKEDKAPRYDGARAKEALRRSTRKTCRKIDEERLADRKKRLENGGISEDGIFRPL